MLFVDSHVILELLLGAPVSIVESLHFLCEFGEEVVELGLRHALVLLVEERGSPRGEVLDAALQRIVVWKLIDIEVVDMVVGGSLTNPI